MVTSAMDTTTFDIDAVIAQLHDEASERTGFDDFGPDDYKQGFRRLAAHLGCPDLTESGLAYVREEIVNALAGRLIREDEWKRHPEHAGEKIEKPLVICGIPRTGTTALHKVMAIDPQFQGLDNWLTSWPKPRPPRQSWSGEQGFRNAVATLERMYAQVPEMKVTHEMVADEVDECLEVLRLDFTANRFPSSFIIPEYDAWYQQQDEKPLYRRLRKTIQLIGLGDRRKWLLKNPGHFAQMEALLDAFPDAQIVITHRDPVKSLPSLCSLLSDLRKMVYKNADSKLLGPRELDYWSAAKASTSAMRSKIPADQIIDIDHSDFHRDPIGTVRSIYEHFGLELSPEVAQNMQAWLDANPAGKHGAHTYEVEDYGTSAEQIRAKLGEG